jgi:hypothetical protein
MADPQHRTREYVAAYRAIRRAQAAGEVLVCVEPRCLAQSRVIAPHHRASVSHDTSGLVILGPSHLRCNLSEAAIRGNKMRAKQRQRWEL